MTGTPTTTPLSPPPRGGGATPVAQPWYWRLGQATMAYLPVVLMALLAASTWWLVKNSMPAGEAGAAAPLKHEPDYEMHRFSVQRYNADGSMRVRLEGDVLRHYPDTDTLEIDHVRLHAVSSRDGRVTTAVARRAVSNGEATEIELFGGAEIVREPLNGDEAMHFLGEYLHAFLDEDRLLSDQPVTMRKGNTEMKADGMEYTHADGVVRFTGRSRATFGPKTKP